MFMSVSSAETDTRDAVLQNNSSDSCLKVMSDAFVTNPGQKLNKTPFQKTKHVTVFFVQTNFRYVERVVLHFICP